MLSLCRSSQPTGWLPGMTDPNGYRLHRPIVPLVLHPPLSKHIFGKSRGSSFGRSIYCPNESYAKVDRGQMDGRWSRCEGRGIVRTIERSPPAAEIGPIAITLYSFHLHHPPPPPRRNHHRDRRRHNTLDGLGHFALQHGLSYCDPSCARELLWRGDSPPLLRYQHSTGTHLRPPG